MADRPELMAIGDSIYNGTRSLTTNGELARNSAPAQVANAFKWRFVTPTYPFDVLFNLETIVRKNEFSLDKIVAGAVANAKAWLAQPSWSAVDTFDNISIAQSTISDQWTFTFEDQFAKIPDLIAKLQAGTDRLNNLMALYMAVNVSFLLNPSRKADSPWAKLTPLEIIGKRQPKRLLVNLGINDGVWTICLQATGDKFNKDQLRADMNKLGGKLRDMVTAGQVDRIYLNLLPKPSCIANLMPRVDPQKVPGPSGYYDEYLGRLGQLGGLSGKQMADLDAMILTLNQDIQAYLTATFQPIGGGIDFVDLYAMAAARDGKHFRDHAPIWVDNEYLSNVPLESFVHKGGLFGLDNLHPTTVGYAVLAQTVCARIAAVEQIPVLSPPDFTTAFHNDSLLQHVPPLLDLVNLFGDMIAAFAGVAGAGAPAPALAKVA
jgi:hypothetical protein